MTVGRITFIQKVSKEKNFKKRQKSLKKSLTVETEHGIISELPLRTATDKNLDN